jgi:1,4-dihydroxy-2-naphthoyl-CoA synthase
MSFLDNGKKPHTMEFESANSISMDRSPSSSSNHPEVMNAVSPEMVGGLMKVLDEVDRRRDEVHCVIITGEGRGFCAGANLRPASGERVDAGMLLETIFHPFLRRLRKLPVPLGTAGNCGAAGVGMSPTISGARPSEILNVRECHVLPR